MRKNLSKCGKAEVSTLLKQKANKVAPITVILWVRDSKLGLSACKFLIIRWYANKVYPLLGKRFLFLRSLTRWNLIKLGFSKQRKGCLRHKPPIQPVLQLAIGHNLKVRVKMVLLSSDFSQSPRELTSNSRNQANLLPEKMKIHQQQASKSEAC